MFDRSWMLDPFHPYSLWALTAAMFAAALVSWTTAV